MFFKQIAFWNYREQFWWMKMIFNANSESFSTFVHIYVTKFIYMDFNLKLH